MLLSELNFNIPLWIVSLFLILAIVSGIFLILYSIIQGRKVKKIRTSRIYQVFLLCLLLPIFWCSGQLYEVFYGKQESGPVFYMEYLAVCFGALVWLLFCLEYAEIKFLSKRKNVFLLIMLPVFFYLSVLTNDFHNLFTYFEDGSRKYGIIFMMHFIVFITYTFIGVLLLFRFSLKRKSNSKVLPFLLMMTFFIPVILTTMKVLGVIQFDIVSAEFTRKDFDLSSVSFLVSMIIFTIAFFKFRFMNITPIALKNIFGNISEAIMVIDEDNYIISINRSFEENFPEFLTLQNRDKLIDFVEYLDNLIEDPSIKSEIFLKKSDMLENELIEEICINNQPKRYFSVVLRPLYHKGTFIGRIISFNDISEHKLLLEDLHDKNCELSTLNGELSVMNKNLVESNKKIKEYAKAVRELTVIRERNRFARDVHDTLGHSMVILIALLEASRLSVFNDGKKTDMILEKAINTARNGLNEIRSSLKNLVEEENCERSLIDRLDNLIMEHEITGIKIDFSVDEGIENISGNISEVIFRTCQESITNSIKHGKATEMSFVLKVFESAVKLYIFDNGDGCSNIKMGMGLSGMKQRIEELNGSLLLSSRDNNGFNITVELPVSDN